ncbi:hypothetical protein MKJ04_04605 [Pontibacter sp. E15-1]|uniref:hypothetical protein n=1 Tax=Pontibacter sp. E15-1 TaxID=2919918 RepID=UPI001F501537|nr:hypothetical protein [Pontibacter sp. E15-1]MCJ8164111.1 hypothetical protein [Pontibacter sp. E15-1]
MSFLLRLKHWQAFLLLFVVPFALRYGLLSLLAALSVQPGVVAMLLLDAMPSLVYVLWLWRLGLYLYRRLPPDITISSVFFHLGAVYFALYTLLLVYTLGLVRESVLLGTLPFGMLLLLAPLHLLATGCFLYLVYFVARSLVSVEQGRVVTGGEFAGAYLQIIFLPLGIWFLQPRLHQITLGAAQV